MADTRLPPSLAAELKELHRRVSELERSPRLTYATVTGKLTVRRADGTLTAELGGDSGNLILYGADGDVVLRIEDTGMTVNDANATEVAKLGTFDGLDGVRLSSGGVVGLEFSAQDGLTKPNAPVSGFFTVDFQAITFGTLDVAQRWYPGQINTHDISVSVSVGIDSGVTGCEFRLRTLDFNRSVLTQSSIFTLGAGPANGAVRCQWKHGVPIFTQGVTLELLVSRSGTGAVNVHRGVATQGRYTGATTGGAWSYS